MRNCQKSELEGDSDWVVNMIEDKKGFYGLLDYFIWFLFSF